ncbi:glycosyltransferase family 87 protein [Streptacidiphilus sp. N1-3]|uniref:Glycosyltransferase family 87 protein n=1 Tax=Streptacidiphilus alkalitolerans TaxID=3342712 RepID=A0ABV6XAE3_9ACTN
MTTTHAPTRTDRSTSAATPPGAPARRLPWVLGWLGCAIWAACFPLVSSLSPQRTWGLVAAVGYTAALAAAALLPRRQVARVSAALALLGAVAVPLGIMTAEGWSQSEVLVVQNSAVQLLHTGTPYLPDPHQVIGYDPYLPAMALFGLPRALLGDHGTLPRMAGDPRIWFLAAFAGCLVASWRLLRTPGAPVRRWGTAVAAVTASPLVALVAVTGGVDLPLIGCCCLALALAGRGHAGRAGLVLALACAIKWTAWPALPVAAALLLQLYGRRAALRCTAVALAAAAVLVAPFVLLSPHAVAEQVIRFPLGMSTMRTAAASPLPGHLLAGLGAGGRTADFVLLALGGAAVAGWVLRRPPRTALQAADRLAVGVSIAFLLAPAGRFGYLELPALLLLWPRLATARPVALRLPPDLGSVRIPRPAGRVRPAAVVARIPQQWAAVSAPWRRVLLRRSSGLG